ncbi:DUF58 domain-containing protein [Salipaludibacillus sp. CUR1]|uniref:DUF58 domain-containing protein n=1 Tax=Salipaludibacillus sp. CUR1 TaxID=2820003 RepID=UPI001E60DBB2|nr:DUF58 domain-containing protein [Salipaludibacillus sp. CUR1]
MKVHSANLQSYDSKHVYAVIYRDSVQVIFYFLLFFMVVVTLVTRDSFIASLTVFFLLMALLNRLYLTYLCRTLVWGSAFKDHRIFPGTDNKLSIIFKNQRVIPVLSASCQIKVNDPEKAVEILQDGKWSSPEEINEISFQLQGFSQFIYEVELKGIKRGPVLCSHLEITLYDLFHLNYIKLYAEQSLSSQMIVYPRITETVYREQDISHGDNHARALLAFNEDALVRNNRPYEYGDPLNRIHWKLSAKSGEWFTKEYEKKNEPNWTIVTNLNDYYAGSFVNENIENILSHAAFLCLKATEKNTPFELILNQTTPRSDYGLHLKAGEGREHLSKALEILARVRRLSMTIHPEIPLSFLIREYRYHPVVFQLGYVTETMENQIAHLEKQGSSVHIVPFNTGPLEKPVKENRNEGK